MPGRRLRFDSATESRVNTRVPAGSPFLTHAHLQSLLAEAQPITAPTPRRRASDIPVSGHGVIDWATRVREAFDTLLLRIEAILPGRGRGQGQGRGRS